MGRFWMEVVCVSFAQCNLLSGFPSETYARIEWRAVPPPVLSSFRSIHSSLAAVLHDPLHQDGHRRAKAVHLLVAQPLKEAATRDPNAAFIGGVPDASKELLP